MAGRRLVARSGEVSTGTTNPKTLLLVKAPADAWLEVVSAEIFFQGVNAANVPHRVQVYKATSDGTGTSVTPEKIMAADTDSIRSTAGKNYSSEPGLGDVIADVYVDPAKGFWVFNFAQIGFVQLKAGERLAIRVVDPDDNIQIVSCITYVE